MSALTEFLYPAPARRSVGSILGWWEKRRLAYNLAVGAAGLISLGVGAAVMALPPNGFVLMPQALIVIPIFGVMANVCYCLGPLTELVIEKLWGKHLLPTGPSLYRMGLTFSIGLALLPALMTLFGWFARVVFAIL